MVFLGGGFDICRFLLVNELFALILSQILWALVRDDVRKSVLGLVEESGGICGPYICQRKLPCAFHAKRQPCPSLCS
jgi:hypothetical protein